MARYFVSRHPGAIAWAKQNGLSSAVFVTHLDERNLNSGDTLIGSLPAGMAARLCKRGIRYWHLNIELPAHLRGCELSAEEMGQLGVRLQPLHITERSIAADEADMAPLAGQGTMRIGYETTL